MRGMVRQIADEIALERGHMEVNVELFEKVEALGEFDDSKGRQEMPWSDDALAMLFKKTENAPAMAEEFVFQMIKRDAEDLARTKGIKQITAETLKILWESPLEVGSTTLRKRESGPPFFVIFSNRPLGVKEPYRRYIENSLRKRFDFTGTPIKLIIRKKK